MAMTATRTVPPTVGRSRTPKTRSRGSVASRPTTPHASADECYNPRRDDVETSKIVTLVLYSVGIAAAATGVGLILYDVFSDSPADFSDRESAERDDDDDGLGELAIVPMLAPDGESAGFSLVWTW